MGFKVIFSDNFVNDLRDITSYISKDNPQAAITLGDALISEAFSLDEHPNSRDFVGGDNLICSVGSGIEVSGNGNRV